MKLNDKVETTVLQFGYAPYNQVPIPIGTVGMVGAVKVPTWLPVFSGFYGTIWETDNDEDRETEYINEQRQKKGLNDIERDDIEWDYDGYRKAVAEGATDWIGLELHKLGMIDGYQFEELRSPREYNFANDAINIEFEISKKNVENIKAYLKKNETIFKEYIKEQYTSRDGFCSSYSNDYRDWIGENLEDTLNHSHKLGTVLEFILKDGDDENRIEWEIYEDLTGNGVTLHASNYSELTRGK